MFHDYEQASYDRTHPEIIRDEVERWRQISQRFVGSMKRPLRVLDLGSGTGFVPLQLGPLLGANDVLVCSDISERMLDVCRQTMTSRYPGLTVEYLNLDGKRLEQPDASLDVVTMNSVLHHLPDFGFLRELDRVIKPGGRLIICHEHNRAFYTNPILVANFFLFFVLCHPEKLINKFRRRAPVNAADETFYRQVNHTLLEQDVIQQPMTKNQINEIVDIHSPFAGGRFHRGRGIDIEALRRRYLPNFAGEYFSTYGHLDSLTNRNCFTRFWSRFLGWLLPLSGATFAAVFRKRA